jgi:hypothetical protein
MLRRAIGCRWWARTDRKEVHSPEHLFAPVYAILAPIRTCPEVPGASHPFADSSSSESHGGYRLYGSRPSQMAKRGQYDVFSSCTFHPSDHVQSPRVLSLSVCTLSASGPAILQTGESHHTGDELGLSGLQMRLQLRARAYRHQQQKDDECLEEVAKKESRAFPGKA